MFKDLNRADKSVIGSRALRLIEAERLRQIYELGYGYDHDDGHETEELAAAAAFFLIPQLLNRDVCVVGEDYTMQVLPLLDLIGTEAWSGLHRDDYEEPALRVDVSIDARINQLVKGLALGLAELERWMRVRERRAQRGDH